jgi:hypothetical protein
MYGHKRTTRGLLNFGPCMFTSIHAHAHTPTNIHVVGSMAFRHPLDCYFHTYIRAYIHVLTGSMVVGQPFAGEQFERFDHQAVGCRTGASAHVLCEHMYVSTCVV